MSLCKILCLKSSKPKELKKLNSNATYLSGINKELVQKLTITKDGIVGNEVADKLHHGNQNKAIMFMSKLTYGKLNELCDVNFNYNDTAFYGENIVVDSVDEDDICVGDVLKIGEVLLEVSQPRQPCWKLSSATLIKDMTTKIYKNGLTGWYARVLKEGEITQGNSIKLEQRCHPNLSIKNLNMLIQDPSSNKTLTKEALECEKLGYQFRDSLRARAKLGCAKDEPFAYHNEPL